MGGGILWIGSQILVYYNMDKTVNVNKWMDLVKEMKSPNNDDLQQGKTLPKHQGVTNSGETVGNLFENSLVDWPVDAGGPIKTVHPYGGQNIYEDRGNTTYEINKAPFANAEEGNAFRAWINEQYPEYAAKIDLDAEGSFDNPYIQKAWEEYGQTFLASQSPPKEEKYVEGDVVQDIPLMLQGTNQDGVLPKYAAEEVKKRNIDLDAIKAWINEPYEDEEYIQLKDVVHIPFGMDYSDGIVPFNVADNTSTSAHWSQNQIVNPNEGYWQHSDGTWYPNGQHVLSQGYAKEDPGFFDIVGNVIANPYEAFARGMAYNGRDAWDGTLGEGYSLDEYGHIPNPDGFNFANEIVNPAKWVENIDNSLDQGNYGAAGTEAAFSFLPFLKPFKKWGKWNPSKGGSSGVNSVKAITNKADNALITSGDDVIDANKNLPHWSKGITQHHPQGYHTNPAIRDSYITSGAMDAKNAQLLNEMTTYGNKLDNMGYDASTIIGENVRWTDPSKYSNRTIVEIAMPDGNTQLFFKSSGNAGKDFRGTGTSEGIWSPFPGHHAQLSDDGRIIDSWFVKGNKNQYDNFYHSKSYEDISNRLNELEKSQMWDMSQQGFKSLRTPNNPMGLPINASKEELEIFLKDNPGLAFPQLKKYGGGLPKAQNGVPKNIYSTREKNLEAKNYLREYLMSPMYLERLAIEFPGYPKEVIEAERDSRLKNLNTVKVSISDEPLNAAGNWGGILGQYVPKEHNQNAESLRLNKEAGFPPHSIQFEPNPHPFYQANNLHEYSHALESDQVSQKTADFIDGITNHSSDYLRKPTEFVARIQAVRYRLYQEGLYNPMTEKFTEEHLKLLKNNFDIRNDNHYRDLYDILKGDTKEQDKNLIKSMNEIAMELPTPDIGSQFYDEKLAKEGTEVKDPFYTREKYSTGASKFRRGGENKELPKFQKEGSVKQKLKNLFRTKKQKKIDEANQQFASYNESDKVVNVVDDDTYDDEYTAYDADITNSYGDKGYESTSYNNYVKNIKLYGIDVANQIYMREGKDKLPTEVIKSNPTLGFDPYTGTFSTMDVLNKRYNVGVKNKQVLPEGYDFNTYDPNKAWLDNAPGTINETEINEKKPTNIKGSLNSGDILNGWTPEWSLKEIRDMETPEDWDDYNPLNAAERLKFAEVWNRFSSPGSKRGGRVSGEYGFLDYWGNAEDTRTYRPSYNYGNDVREIDPNTGDNLIFYADKDGNPVGDRYTNNTPYTQRILDWRDGSGNDATLTNAILDDGSKLQAEQKYGEDVLYRDVPIAGAVATAPLWGPPLYGGLTTAGTATYNAVLPYTQATIAGIPGFTLGNLANATGISYGLTEIGPDTYDFIKDPSWPGLGNIAMDLLGIAGLKGTPKFNVPKVNVPKVNVQNVNKIDDITNITNKSDDIVRGVTKNSSGNIKTSFDNKLTTHTVEAGDQSVAQMNMFNSNKLKVQKGELSVGTRNANIEIASDASGKMRIDIDIPTKSHLIKDGGNMVLQTTNKPGVFDIHMTMHNPKEAYHSMKYLEEFMPKGSILSTTSFSTDSYKLMLNRLRNGKFTYVDEGGTSFKHLTQSGKVQGGYGVQWPKDEALIQITQINKQLEKAGIPYKAKLGDALGDGTYMIDIPDVKILMGYKLGGEK
jgi:hypothetical protein